MPRPNIRPWRDLEELLNVRQLLYPHDETEHDRRYDDQRLGVNVVSFHIDFIWNVLHVVLGSKSLLCFTDVFFNILPLVCSLTGSACPLKQHISRYEAD